MSNFAVIATAAASLVIVGACTVNSEPAPVPAPLSATTVSLPPPSPAAAPPGEVIVPGRY